ncbi:MAG: T9SS type A sorting domain-containing protein [Bacteroidetes bacterium]|nr:T9SS type A sorting domain-containing protein [Bacteroidota bacterium]
MWPINNTQTFVNFFQNNGLSQAPCITLSAGFEADVVEICEENSVNFTDQSVGDIITWDWTFEGGNPASSSEENPTVTYDIDGTYDVQLIVGDGVETSTTLMENYISVYAYPNTTLDPFAVACVQWTELELTGGLPDGGVYSGEFVENGFFTPATAGVGDHTIFYSYTNDEGCEAIAEETLTVDACTGFNENSVDGIKIYPNPATKLVNLTSASKIISIQVFNHIGQLVLDKNVDGNSCQLVTSEFESGVYSIKLETEQGFVIKQIVIE